MVIARKLRPYFQAHPIVALTSYLIKGILHKLELFKRMLRWSVELSEYDINCKPWPMLKGQVVVDFIAEFTEEIQEDQQVDKDYDST